MITNSSPAFGVNPAQLAVLRVTLAPIATAPLAAIWSWWVSVLPGVVPPISTLKVLSSASVTFPPTLNTPGDAPGAALPSRINCGTITSGAAAFVSPIRAVAPSQ